MTSGVHTSSSPLPWRNLKVSCCPGGIAITKNGSSVLTSTSVTVNGLNGVEM